jgi:hypothetical protein
MKSDRKMNNGSTKAKMERSALNKRDQSRIFYTLLALVMVIIIIIIKI